MDVPASEVDLQVRYFKEDMTVEGRKFAKGYHVIASANDRMLVQGPFETLGAARDAVLTVRAEIVKMLEDAGLGVNIIVDVDRTKEHMS